MPTRKGTNFQDRNAIQDYVNAGVVDPNVIAQNLKLDPGPVKRYVDKLTGKAPAAPKRTRKAAKKAPAAEPAPVVADAAPDAPTAQEGALEA